MPNINKTKERTPFYALRKRTIQSDFDRMYQRMIKPWLLLYKRPESYVENCKGDRITCEDITETGWARPIYWEDFSDPYIIKVIQDQIVATVEDCNKLPNLLHRALDETADLLHQPINHIYKQMAEVWAYPDCSGISVEESKVLGLVDDKAKKMIELMNQCVKIAKRSTLDSYSSKDLKKIIRQQVKAEIQSMVADDALVAAYKEHGSCNKAAEYLSKQTEQTTSKDKVYRAVQRAGGIKEVSVHESSDSVVRAVASQRRDSK